MKKQDGEVHTHDHDADDNSDVDDLLFQKRITFEIKRNLLKHHKTNHAILAEIKTQEMK